MLKRELLLVRNHEMAPRGDSANFNAGLTEIGIGGAEDAMRVLAETHGTRLQGAEMMAQVYAFRMPNGTRRLVVVMAKVRVGAVHAIDDGMLRRLGLHGEKVLRATVPLALMRGSGRRSRYG
jgi:hypothetical protein